MSPGKRPPRPTGGAVAIPKKKKDGFFNRFFVSGPLDATFLLIVLALLALGLVMMFSAGYTYAYYNRKGDALWFFKRQIVFAVIGVAAMLFISKLNYRKLSGWIAPLVYFISLGLLVLVLIVNHGDDFKRWLNIGISIQPSEIAKFAVILFLSYCISRQYKLLHSNKKMNFRAIMDSSLGSVSYSDEGLISTNFFLTCFYAASILIVAVLIYLENHLSGTILILLIGMSMMWLGGVKKRWFAIVGAIAVVAAVYLIFINPELLKEYAGDRITAWLDKDFSPQKYRWQTNHGLYAIASGGPFGLGFGNSREKNLFVSEPQNDFVFSIVCEELGFVGGVAIIVLFAALVCRGFMIASKTRDTFGALLCMGIVLQIGIQTALNIMVVTDTIPNTGISLPFFSYGGSSLMMILMEMGLVLSVSRQSYIRKL